MGYERWVRSQDIWSGSLNFLDTSSLQVYASRVYYTLEQVDKPSEGLALFLVDTGKDLPGHNLRTIRKWKEKL